MRALALVVLLKVARIMAIPLLLGSLAACIYVPPVWDAWDVIYKVDQIEVGKTTRNEVLDLLGDPDSGDRENAEVFRYAGMYSDGYIIGGRPYIGGSYGGLIDEERWWIKVAFDENGVVEEVTSSRK